MNHTWSDDQPIYHQLRDRMVAMILEGAIAEGEALPSTRTVSAEYRINPLTVLKAYQELSDDGIVENRRGVGLFVNLGARDRLLRTERRRFLEEEWPRIRSTIQRLGLKPEELLRSRTAATRPKARTR